MSAVNQPHSVPSGPPGRRDPLLCEFPLPLRERFFPMGFPLEVETNSPVVLAAAVHLWGAFPPLAEAAPPAILRVGVGASSTIPSQVAPPRGKAHLMTIVHSPENFAVADLDSGFGFAWLTEDIVADRAYCTYHFLEPLVCTMLDALHFTPLHASCIARNGKAIVLCGESGAGKTTLAYACARRGWLYLADDATHLIRSSLDFRVVGRPYSIRFRESARLLFPELNRFHPILRPNGKLDIEAATDQLGLPTALACPASHMVFLRRDAGAASARLQMFPLEEAARRLEEVVCYGSERIRSEQREAIRRFAQLPSYELTYSDFDAAERALRLVSA